MPDAFSIAETGRSSLHRMLSPRSIAIVGASTDPVRIGGRPLARLISEGFPGTIYPVNPARDMVQGLPAVKGVLDLPEGVDCAIVVVAAEQAVQAIRDCVTRKVGSVVLMSAGFAEAGERGVALQDELTAIARSSGMRIVGPNCMGLFNVGAKAHLSFASWVPPAISPTFNLAVVSQSGGYGTHVLRLCQRRDIVVSHWLTTGNECDVNAGELVGTVAELPEVNAIFVYLEGLRSAEALIAGLEKAHARRVPVVVIKSGASEVGAAAAASHTASLAGADQVYDAVFRSYGVFRAQSTEEAMDVVYALSRRVLPADSRTCVFTLSGGVGVQIADFMAEAGVPLEELSASAQETIRGMVPQAGTRNPVDITAQFMNDLSVVEASLDLVMGREKFNVVLSFLSAVGLVPHLVPPIAAAYGEMNRRYPGRLNVIAMIGTPEVVKMMENAGCLVFEEARRAVRALAALHGFARAFSQPLPDRKLPAGRTLPRIARGQRFNEVQAKEVALACGVPVPQERVASGPAEAARAASQVGFPVAVKVVSADILHKTEVGGVRLGLADGQAVHEAVETMAASVRLKAPGAKVEGYVVSPMMAGGVECVVGVVRDPVFGPVVMFGLGGVLIELMQDVAFRLAPVNEAQALAMIHETRGARLLAGFRGAPPADVPALARAIVAVSELATANADTMLTLELNPLRVLAAGQGVIALDAVIEAQPA
jgi:acyl-CoA synthetase (NDP forming)